MALFPAEQPAWERLEDQLRRESAPERARRASPRRITRLRRHVAQVPLYVAGLLLALDREPDADVETGPGRETGAWPAPHTTRRSYHNNVPPQGGAVMRRDNDSDNKPTIPLGDQGEPGLSVMGASDQPHRSVMGGSDEPHPSPMGGSDEPHPSPMGGSDEPHRSPMGGSDEPHRSPMGGSDEPHRSPMETHR